MRTLHRLLLLLLPVLLPLVSTGCTGSHAPSTSTKLVKIDDDDRRDTDRARVLNEKGAALLNHADYQGAEKILKQAISADAEFGPAQNNLGVIYYKESKLYLAARQFLLSAALMPRDPRPRNGLGLVFESSNRFDDAINYYDRARALEPQSLEYLGNSARARIRRGDRTDEVRAMLVTLASNDPRDDWNQWARRTLQQMNHAPATRSDAALAIPPN